LQTERLGVIVEDMSSRTIIIGNGIAGFTVASALAKAGKDVIQYSEEPCGFYSRIKLPQVLCDEDAMEKLPAAQCPVYLKQGNVTAFDPVAKTVTLKDGQTDRYDNLVLATGSRGRSLPIFSGVNGVTTLRTLADAKLLSHELKDPVCVLGGGLLGVESARAIASKGFSVTVLEGGPHILCRQLNEDAADILRAKLKADGLGIEEAFAVDSVEQQDGNITAVVSKEGKRVPCRTMLLSVGVNPEVTLARNAGLRVERAIVVDDHLRTSAPDVYAIGDCAQYQGMVPGIMPVAMGMANTLTQILLGKDATYEPPQLMTRLKDTSFDLISIGSIEGKAIEQTDGDRHIFLFTHDGILCGAILLNAADQLAKVKEGMGKPFSAF